MAYSTRKYGRKSVMITPATTSRSRTLGRTNRLTLPVLNSSDNLSTTNVTCSRGGQDALLEKAKEEYEDEYSVYLLRALQAKIIRSDSNKEEQMKECLVSLKREYEKLLNCNVQLLKSVKQYGAFGENIDELNSMLGILQHLDKILKENEFYLVLRKLYQNFELNVNRLHLLGLKRTDIENAFSQNLLGVDSDIHKLLDEMRNYATEHNSLMSEIVELIEDVNTINKENEELRIRCNDIACYIRRKNIISNYKHYFNKALEECNSYLHELNLPAKDYTLSETNQTLDLCLPSSSSTPAN